MKDIILVGAFIETIELCEECNYNIVGVVEDRNVDTCGYPWLGNDEEFLAKKESYIKIPLVNVPDSPIVRERLFNMYKKNGFSFETVISPHAKISKSAKVGEGCVIQAYSNISAKVIIGDCVRINTGANIMHECVVGSFSTIAPNVVLLGRCDIGEYGYIGANSTVLPNHKIERNVIVGAGAIVTKDVSEGKVVVGNPAHEINR